MQISTRKTGNVLVIDMSGSLDTSTSGEAYDEMVKIVKGGSKQILVNLEKVEYISSAGLRVILTAAKLLKTARGEMRFCHPNNVVREVLEVSGFHSLLRVDETEPDSLATFGESQ